MTTASAVPVRPVASRRVGYAVAVLIDAALLLLLNVSPGWSALPFLTEGFATVLPVVNLSLVVALLVNAVQLVTDPAWLVAAGQLLNAAIALIVSLRLLGVFPFDFSAYSWPWDTVITVILWVGLIGSAIAIVVSVVRLVRAVTIAASEG